jgi:hypothetical protein
MGRGKRRGTGSTAGKLGKKAPRITAEWGGVTIFREPSRARTVPIRAKYAGGRCAECGTEIRVGSSCRWRPVDRALLCTDCGEA